MINSGWTPSIVPGGRDETIYLVLDCFGRSGCVWRETNIDQTDLETVLADLMAGQYSDPRRVIAFNTAERWSQDVTEKLARELRRRADLAHEDLPSTIEAFVDRHAGYERQLALGLPAASP